VIGISWDAAMGFLTWLNKQGTEHYRLPSEAEWEYAARAGTSGASPASSVESAVGGPTEDSEDDRTHPVAQGAANPWGLYDMTGGVFEWVQDCYQEDYAGAPTDGAAWLAGDCSRRVARGGPVRKDSSPLSFTTRHWHVKTFHFGLRGFRLARDY
jgi:formylglycine-generating enzyme required for sulfatase activity